jgi:hypothetical protein
VALFLLLVLAEMLLLLTPDILFSNVREHSRQYRILDMLVLAVFVQ